ncbi:hypothetical protein ACTFIV_005179 [Dictyostelium citrinum]
MANKPAMRPDKFVGNQVAEYVKQGSASAGQALQCLVARGYLTDHNSRIFVRPVMGNYVEGLDAAGSAGDSKDPSGAGLWIESDRADCYERCSTKHLDTSSTVDPFVVRRSDILYVKPGQRENAIRLKPRLLNEKVIMKSYREEGEVITAAGKKKKSQEQAATVVDLMLTIPDLEEGLNYELVTETAAALKVGDKTKVNTPWGDAAETILSNKMFGTISTTAKRPAVGAIRPIDVIGRAPTIKLTEIKDGENDIYTPLYQLGTVNVNARYYDPAALWETINNNRLSRHIINSGTKN